MVKLSFAENKQDTEQTREETNKQDTHKFYWHQHIIKIQGLDSLIFMGKRLFMNYQGVWTLVFVVGDRFKKYF